MTSIKVSIPAIIMQMYAAKKYGAAEATRFDQFTVTMTHPGRRRRTVVGGRRDDRAFHVSSVSSAGTEGSAHPDDHDVR